MLLRKPSSNLHGALVGLCSSLLAALTLAAGCSSDPEGTASTTDNTTSSSSTGGGSGGSGGTGGTGGAGGGNACEGQDGCKPAAIESNATPIVIDKIEATLLDENDAPIADQLAFACGVDICPPPEASGPDGHVLLSIGNKMLKQPAFKYGDGLLYGKFAAVLTDASTVFPKAYTPKLPEMGEQLVAGGEATSGGVTITLEAGTVIEIDVLAYDTCEAQAFRAASIPTAKAPAGLDPALGLEILYAVGPVETFFCPAAMVTVPNTPGWASGTAVEFYVHGLSVGQEHVPYGEWAKISDGVVSADGKSISTAAGGGLPVLSAFGIKKK
jgi:hypothetical protein